MNTANATSFCASAVRPKAIVVVAVALAALAGLAFVMIHFLNWGLIPVFAVLAALLAAAAIGAYKLLMKNVKKYYFAG